MLLSWKILMRLFGEDSCVVCLISKLMVLLFSLVKWLDF